MGRRHGEEHLAILPDPNPTRRPDFAAAAAVEAGLDRLVVEKAFASALRNTCGPRWPIGDVGGELDDVLAFAYAERRRDVFTTALRSKSRSC